jgi:hypothetical protein
MAGHAQKASDGDTVAGPQRTAARLALAAGIVALALSPIVAYVAASFGGGSGPGTPAVWSVPGVALVVLYAMITPAGAFTAWGTAGSGRLPLAGALVAVTANLAALGVLLGVRGDDFTWGPGILVFLALFLLPALLAALAAPRLRRPAA